MKTPQLFPARLFSTLSQLAIACTLVTSFFTSQAKADYTQRFSLGAGIAEVGNPSSTYFDLGIEYEYRIEPMFGVGAFGEHIFSSPGISEIGAPESFFHPFSTDFLINASPIIQFGSDVGTHVGMRFGARLPIPLGVVTLIPIFAIDLISGGPNYVYGLGFEF